MPRHDRRDLRRRRPAGPPQLPAGACPHLDDIERTELARRVFGAEGQLTDGGLTAVCLCGIEVDVSAANEGSCVLADG